MTEEQLHKQICTYIKMQYPKVIFISDLAGVKLTMGQAKKLKHLRSSKGFPDIFIYERGLHHIGLFLEVKRVTPFKKDGTLKASQNNHIEEQSKFHSRLLIRGYLGGFVWSFDQAKKIIDNYLYTH